MADISAVLFVTRVAVKTLHGVELLLPLAPGYPKVKRFGFLDQKLVVVEVFSRESL